MPMQIETMDPIPAGENPFLYDHYHMGTRIGENIIIMHAKHTEQKQGYVIVCNTETGERFKIHFDQVQSKKDGQIASVMNMILASENM